MQHKKSFENIVQIMCLIKNNNINNKEEVQFEFPFFSFSLATFHTVSRLRGKRRVKALFPSRLWTSALRLLAEVVFVMINSSACSWSALLVCITRLP